MGDLALPDQIGHYPGHFLHRHIGVSPVLVVEVNVIRPQPPQGIFYGGSDHCGPGIRHKGLVHRRAAHVKVDAELGGDDHLLPPRPQRGPHQFLVVVGIFRRSVDLGGIEEGISHIRRLLDQADGLGSICGRTVGMGETHAPKAKG